MDWKVIAVFTPLLFVIYQTLSKLLPKDTSIFLVNAVASLAGAIVMFILHILTSGKSISLDTKVLPLTILIGVLISMGNFLVIKAYNLGAPQSSFGSIFYPLFILYGLIFGLVIWKEQFSIIQMGGLFLTIVGIVLITYFGK